MVKEEKINLYTRQKIFFSFCSSYQ